MIQKSEMTLWAQSEIRNKQANKQTKNMQDIIILFNDIIFKIKLVVLIKPRLISSVENLT